GGGTEQNVIDLPFVLQCERRQFVREREHHMKIGDRKQLLFPLVQPGCASHRLTFRAMPVAARVVLDLLMTAVMALVHMTAQCGSPALRHRTKDFPLLTRKRVPVLREEL